MKKLVGSLLILTSFLIVGLIYFSEKKITLGLDLLTSEEMGEVIIDGSDNLNTTKKVVKDELVFKTKRTKRNKLNVKIVDSNNNEMDLAIEEKIVGSENVYKLSNNRDLRPGKYRILIEDSRGNVKEEEFWWGVLAVNTNKSAYDLGEKVKVEMAVLDEYGAMVCDARTKIIVTGPDGQTRELTSDSGQIWVNPECQIKGITFKPDYESGFDLGEKTGKYKLEFVAETRNGSYQTENYFEVVDGPSFEVERQINTRLFPFEINRAKIKIRANEDFKGKIIEKVPEEFEVYLVENYTEFEEINIGEGKKEIAWEVDLKVNEEKELFYDYDAPDESPAYFELGEIRMVPEDGQTEFEEIRLWQMAVDAEVVIASTLRDATAEYNPAPATVFTDANTGYMFYIYKINVGTTWGQPVYRKTTDGGANWGSPVGIGDSAPNASFVNIAVWYDQWTPGDTTGRKIHIAAVDQHATDELWYNYVDTASSDAQRGAGWSAVTSDGTLYDSAADGNVGITKNTNGDIFATVAGTFGGATKEVVYRSKDSGESFTNTSFAFDASVALDDGDYGQLLPLANGDVLYIVQDITGNNLISKELDVGTSAWKNQLTINSDFVENGTYDVTWSAALNKNTGDVYLVANDKVVQTQASLRFYRFDGVGRTWEERQKLINSSPYLLQGTVAIDPATNDIFVAYLSGEMATNMHVYYKKSFNGGISWSPQSVELNTLTDDFKYIRTNGWSSDLIYVTWYNDDTEDITGIEVPKIVSRSPIPDASVIDLAINDAIDENNNSPGSVFIDENTGYVFYVDTTTTIGYSKTTDGGDTWGGRIAIGNSSYTWANIAVWYDQWTPGDTTGTKIHLVAQDDTTGTEDIWYNYIDTGNGDAQSPSGWTQVIDTTAWTANSYAGPSITKATDGALFIMGAGTIGGSAKTVVMRSGDTGSSWTDTGYNRLLAAGDFGQLLPYSVGATTGIVYLKQDISTNQLESNIYNSGWQTYVDIDVGETLTENTSYDTQWNASLNKSTGDIYLAELNYIGNAGNDLKFYKMVASSGLWETRPNIITNYAQMAGAAVAMDQNSGDIYVTYIGGGAINTTTNINYVQSIDDGQTWSGETRLNTLTDDYKLVRTNLMSASRVVSVWYNDDLNDMVMNSMGITKMRQSGYKWFGNNDSLTAGSTLAGDNTSITLGTGVNQFRLRLLLHAGVAVQALSNKDYKLQYAEKSGSCDTGFSGESYSDVLTGLGVVRFYDNASIGDGATMTVSRYDPLDGGDTVIVQTYEEANNFTNSIDPIYGNKDGEWDFSLGIVGAPASTGYCFRVVKPDGSTLSGGYTYIPEFTTATGASSGPNMSQLLRHGGWFNVSGVRQPFTF